MVKMVQKFMTSMYSLRGRIRGHYDSHAMVGVIASNPRRKNLSFSLALNVTIMAVSSNERRRNVQKVVLCTVISMLIENRRRQLFKRKQVKRFWTSGERANFYHISPDNCELLL